MDLDARTGDELGADDSMPEAGGTAVPGGGDGSVESELVGPSSGSGSLLGRVARRQVSVWYLVLGLLVIAMVSSFQIDSGQGELLAGPAPEIKLDGIGPGSYRFTTVEVRPLSVGGYVLARFSGREVIDVAGGDREMMRESAAASMELSQQTAWAVANSLAGGGSVRVVASITGVRDGSPAQAAGLSVGDSIVAVDGVDLSTAGELPERVSAAGGETVRLSVVRDGDDLEVAIAPERNGDGFRLGVEVAPRPLGGNADRPPIDPSGAGGPSGGLMFTLAYLDQLTDGDLTGGLQVAGTGTIDADGSVGRIDGADLKVEGAISQGADVFMVPALRYEEAAKAARGRVEVVPVLNVGDALAWLCDHNGVSSACP